MDPLALMNNDMATLRLSSQKVFELWNDKVADNLKSQSIEKIQYKWNSYLNEMNTRMRIYMHAEQEVDALIKQINKLAQN